MIDQKNIYSILKMKSLLSLIISYLRDNITETRKN